MRVSEVKKESVRKISSEKEKARLRKSEHKGMGKCVNA